MTTPEQARLDAFLIRAKYSYGWNNLESSARRMVEHAVTEIDALTKERDELQKQVDEFCMAYRMHTDIQNKKLTQEREALTANHKECVRCLGEALQDTANVSVERDALAASMYAYASEFGLDEEGHPDVGSIHQNIRALKAAAKLALDALDNHSGNFKLNRAESAAQQHATGALRRAGVQ